MKGSHLALIGGGIIAIGLIIWRFTSSANILPKASDFAPRIAVPSSSDPTVKATTNVRSSIAAPGKEVTYNNGNVFATYNAAGQLIKTVPV